MQCHLSWDSYKNNICNGFSTLQQREEFVDMTLAADGHLVKVHRNLIALASPYIKQMLKSASCQHPVIFLNNISNEILCYILEYIYTGEVRLPVDKINLFIEAAKALHIRGMDCIDNPMPKQNKMAYDISEQIATANKNNRFVSIDDNSIMRQLIEQNGLSNENYLAEATSVDRVHDKNDTVNDDDQLQKSSVTQHELINIEEEFTDNNTVDNGPHQQEENYILQSLEAQPRTMNIEPKIVTRLNISVPTIHLSEDYNYNMDFHTLPKSNNTGNTTKQENSIFMPAIINSSQNIESHSHQAYNYDLHFQSIPDGKMQNSTGDKDVESNSRLRSTNNNQVIDNDNAIAMQSQEVQPPMNDKLKYPKITINLDNPKENDNFNVETEGFNLDTEGSSTLPATEASSPLYALSNRGWIQLILNRFMYYLHYTSFGGRKRRWRCINYRQQGCKAYVDTDGEIIVGRKFVHCHPFHDDKIVKKGQTTMMYTSIAQVSSVLVGDDDDDKTEQQNERSNH